MAFIAFSRIDHNPRHLHLPISTSSFAIKRAFGCQLLCAEPILIPACSGHPEACAAMHLNVGRSCFLQQLARSACQPLLYDSMRFDKLVVTKWRQGPTLAAPFSFKGAWRSPTCRGGLLHIPGFTAALKNRGNCQADGFPCVPGSIPTTCLFACFGLCLS